MIDQELLARYAEEKDQQAFAELVRRHSGWVYSCAKRLVRDGALAEDVTQAVFILLARKSAGLSSRGGSHLAGWLLRATQYCAREAMRGQGRRRKHEREAAMRRQANIPAEEANCEELWPVLDEAVARLRAKDRDAVLLRFYQGMSFGELAAAIGTGEEAAKKRVQRALGKLRGMLARKGVTAGVTGLAVVMIEKVTEAAPAGVVDGAIAAVNAGSASTEAGMIAKGAMKMMVWAKVKVAAILVLGLAVLGGPAVLALQMVTAAESGVVGGTEVKELPRYRVLGDAWTHIRMEVSRTPERRREIVGDAPVGTTIHFDASSGMAIEDIQFENHRRVVLKSPGRRERLTYFGEINQLRIGELAETSQEIREGLELMWSSDWGKMRARGMLENIPKVAVIRTRDGELDRYEVLLTMDDAEMQPGPTYLWIDPRTGQLLKAVSTYRGETTTSTFSRGEPTFRDIYDVGVPRDAMKVEEVRAK